MASSFGRRDFLKASAALAGTTATGGFVCIGSALAAPIEAPVVDRLAIRVLIDSAYDNAFTAKKVNGVAIQPGPRNAVPDLRKIWHNQWGHVALTPAAVTQHAQWLVLVAVGRPVWRGAVGFVRLRRA